MIIYEFLLELGYSGDYLDKYAKLFPDDMNISEENLIKLFSEIRLTDYYIGNFLPDEKRVKYFAAHRDASIKFKKDIKPLKDTYENTIGKFFDGGLDTVFNYTTNNHAFMNGLNHDIVAHHVAELRKYLLPFKKRYEKSIEYYAHKKKKTLAKAFIELYTNT